jgi:hypothetical protein
LSIARSSSLLWLLGLQSGPRNLLLRRFWDKRKASGRGIGFSSKPNLGATGKLFEGQKAHIVKNGLCHICEKAGHIAKDCPDRDPGRPFDENKKEKKGKKDSKDF